MTTINQLTAVTDLSASDNVPVWSSAQGDTRRFSLTTLVSYLATAFTSLSASSYLKVSGVAVANLPSASTVGAGARATATDATVTTFASVVVGGGANIVPVYSDGTQWRIG